MSTNLLGRPIVVLTIGPASLSVIQPAG